MKNSELRKNTLVLISSTISFNLLLILISKNVNPCLETRADCWYFAWIWNIYCGRTENTSKQHKIVTFVRNWSVKMTSIMWPLSVVMAMVVKAVHKIATDLKGYHKCSLCVIVCWIVKIYQSIAVKKGWLPTY